MKEKQLNQSIRKNYDTRKINLMPCMESYKASVLNIVKILNLKQIVIKTKHRKKTDLLAEETFEFGTQTQDFGQFVLCVPIA